MARMDRSVVRDLEDLISNMTLFLYEDGDKRNGVREGLTKEQILEELVQSTLGVEKLYNDIAIDNGWIEDPAQIKREKRKAEELRLATARERERLAREKEELAKRILPQLDALSFHKQGLNKEMVRDRIMKETLNRLERTAKTLGT